MTTRSTIFQLEWQPEVLSSSWHDNQKYYLPVGMATRSTIFQLAWRPEILSSSWHGNKRYYLLVGMVTRSTIFQSAWWPAVLSFYWHGDQKYYLPVGMAPRSTIFQLAWWPEVLFSLQNACSWHGDQEHHPLSRKRWAGTVLRKRTGAIGWFPLSDLAPVLLCGRFPQEYCRGKNQ